MTNQVKAVSENSRLKPGFGIICAKCRKLTHGLIIAASLAFVACFTFCTVWALVRHGQSGYSFDPAYIPESSHLSQISKIAVISPWAYPITEKRPTNRC